MQNKTKICKTDFELFLKKGKKLHFPILLKTCLTDLFISEWMFNQSQLLISEILRGAVVRVDFEKNAIERISTQSLFMTS